MRWIRSSFMITNRSGRPDHNPTVPVLVQTFYKEVKVMTIHVAEATIECNIQAGLTSDRATELFSEFMVQQSSAYLAKHYELTTHTTTNVLPDHLTIFITDKGCTLGPPLPSRDAA